jgi:hypothetical protein
LNHTGFGKEIIHTLEDSGFYAECPCCAEPILLRDCDLFYLDDFNEKGREIYEFYRKEVEQRRIELRERRQHISESSEIQARATNIGFILERLAPSLSTFRFDCSDCRSLFDPIDYRHLRRVMSERSGIENYFRRYKDRECNTLPKTARNS